MENDGMLPEYKGNLKPEFIAKAKAALDDYKAQKAPIEERVRENNKWYAAQYHKKYNAEKNTTEPATAFVLNAVENKYADAVDNYPQPNFLEREPKDEKTAKLLSSVIPVILKQSDFKRAYKKAWRQKLKHGTGIYGIFFDEAKEQLKTICINILNIYCDTHVDNVQDSPFLFISSIVPNDELRKMYPKYSALFTGDAAVKLGDGSSAEIRGKTEVFDCYYKKYSGGKYIVHMFKMAGGYVLEATEDIETTAEYDEFGNEVSVSEGYEGGLYEHGMYPVVFDVMYPDDSCIFGLGVVDIVKNPQMYIDEIDGIISKNAMLAGKKRFFVKDNCGINENELKDAGNDIIHCAGNVSEDNIREFQISTLDAFIVNHRQNKINELKEVIGNRDFQQGGTSGGVTAASAIATLQQAGEKISRALIDDSYDAYGDIVRMVVELCRQFMTSEEVYRITNDSGEVEYHTFGADMLYDSLGFDSEDKKPVCFDIDIVPQKQNPFSREANNQTVLALWNAGFFNPQMIDMSLAALPVMSFDGKEKIIQALQQYKEQLIMQQQMAAQQAQMQTQIQQEEMPFAEDLGNGYSAVDISGASMPQIEDLGNGYSAVDITG